MADAVQRHEGEDEADEGEDGGPAWKGSLKVGTQNKHEDEIDDVIARQQEHANDESPLLKGKVLECRNEEDEKQTEARGDEQTAQSPGASAMRAVGLQNAKVCQGGRGVVAIDKLNEGIAHTHHQRSYGKHDAEVLKT